VLGGWSLEVDTGGVLLIAGACAAWAIDNNLTQRLTLRDPLAVVRFKAVAATAINLGIAIVVRQADWPVGWVVAAVLALGAVSYGASILLDAHALRLVGAAREAALFATAPFAGAAVAIGLLGDPLTVWVLVAGGLMAVGTVGFLTERHAHRHTHEPVEHEHRHSHDEHHRHDHDDGQVTTEPHSHVHRHDALTHSHPHVSDAHHRHAH
jgi:drug/metabolite transporter (DMT)-like permease